MRPDPDFLNLDLEFWSVIRLLNQRLDYHQRKSKKRPNPRFVIPTSTQIVEVFEKEELDYSRLVNNDFTLTKFGEKITNYFTFRDKLLYDYVEPHLLDAAKAKVIFDRLRARINPREEILIANKQSGDKKKYNYLACMINMLVEENRGAYPFNHDPRELTAVTQNKFPVRTSSRRLDGAFPQVIDPIAVWENKEYYYTTTFGSRVSGGVYETMLDGFEFAEIKRTLGIRVKHYLFIDARLTWWVMGKSYLCRLVDLLHMGLVDEVIVGGEVEVRVPELVAEWIADLEKREAV